MIKSVEIEKISIALSKFQATIKAVKKESDNPFFKSKYADLASIWEAIRAPLTDNGLAVIQDAEIIGDMVTISTLITHISGQWIEGKVGMPVIDKKPQAIGSLCSYGRRYGLSGILGISSGDEDDDGEKSEGRHEAKKPVDQTSAIPAKPKEFNCDGCGIKITQKVAEYSLKMCQGKMLCMECQKTYKPVKDDNNHVSDKLPF